MEIKIARKLSPTLAGVPAGSVVCFSASLKNYSCWFSVWVPCSSACANDRIWFSSWVLWSMDLLLCSMFRFFSLTFILIYKF